jgi:steroid delta-isomerase-like uncharacterized protein
MGESQAARMRLILHLIVKEADMSKEANIAAQKKMGEIINSYQFEKLNEVMAPGVKDHDPADDQGPGPEGFAHWFTQFHSAFPDFKIAVEHLVADEDNVAFAYTITGTQDGPFNGIPATGKKIKVRGMQISKFNSDAMIVERWGASNEAGILQQIGAMKSVPHLDEPPVVSAPASAGAI